VYPWFPEYPVTTTVSEVPTAETRARIACFATQGTQSNDEQRIVALLAGCEAELWPFDRAQRRRSALGIIRRGLRRPPNVIVMEGTGIAGGAALMLLRIVRGIPYVVSSGDAVGPFMGLKSPLLGLLGGIYERILCRLSAGFIGWTPYLAGRALTFGSPRVMTAPGWSPTTPQPGARNAIRSNLGIPQDALVFGIVGSLDWTSSVGYCYGLELVRALAMTDRRDLRVMIVGEGSGLQHLQREAAGCDDRVILPGRVPRTQVADYLSAMDVGSLPQSVDQVGSFRYTTKVSEYLAAGLPIVAGQLPLAYDLDGVIHWRLRGDAPWDPTYVAALAELMSTVEAPDAAAPGVRPSDHHTVFGRDRQRRAVTAFLEDLLHAVR
jgi:glycosyltransferase involved in cell wall biosynthesis